MLLETLLDRNTCPVSWLSLVFVRVLDTLVPKGANSLIPSVVDTWNIALLLRKDVPIPILLAL